MTIKTRVAWNKGKKTPDDVRKKLSESHKGQRPWRKGIPAPWAIGNKYGVGKIPWNKGIKLTDTQKANYNLDGLKLGWGMNKGKKFPHLTGKNNPSSRPEIRKKISESKKGKPNFKLRGENSYFWKGGITPINMKIRNSLEYKLWRESVFKRDNWTCVVCGQRGGKLNADHIKPFAYFPELRFAIDNGRTLCIPCHRKSETWGFKATRFDPNKK